VKRAEAAHREADDVSPVDPQALEHRERVLDGVLLRVGVELSGDCRRRVSTGGVGHTAVARTEMRHLGLPAAVVAGKLVDQEEGHSGPPLLDMESDSVDRGDVRHGHLSSPPIDPWSSL
jgi:hypothetical protein